jgi:hypothetical protein
MKRHLRTLTPLLLSLFFVAAATPWLNAQITNPIQAHVNHSFMIGDKTLPPGDYTFRIEGNTDLGVMIVQNKSGDNLAQFNVRRSIDNHTPKHSELIFRKYGNSEFLSKIYEVGSKSGVAVTEASKEEQRLANSGQHGMEHTEEQP